eukprot:804331_1
MTFTGSCPMRFDARDFTHKRGVVPPEKFATTLLPPQRNADRLLQVGSSHHRMEAKATPSLFGRHGRMDMESSRGLCAIQSASTLQTSPIQPEELPLPVALPTTALPFRPFSTEEPTARTSNHLK